MQYNSGVNKEICKRFGLSDGQFFGEYRYKNLQWFLGVVRFGYGDLRIEDIERIQKELKSDEVFSGWNEHHGTDWQQTDDPMIIINADRIRHRAEAKAEGVLKVIQKRKK